jgi:hypothetical protein
MLKQQLVSESKEEKYGLVYFISCGTKGPIKVGFTADRNPNARIRQLQIGSPEPLTLIGTIMAYASIERTIQTFLGPHHVRGEWFEREPALLLMHRLQMDATFHRSELVDEIAFLLITRAKREPDDEEDNEPLSVRVAHQLLRDWVDRLYRVNTDKPLPFRAWLHGQIERADPTGDLARDATGDPQFPATGSLARYLEYIVERARNSAVTRTLVDAWIECDTVVGSLHFRKQDVGLG